MNFYRPVAYGLIAYFLAGCGSPVPTPLATTLKHYYGFVKSGTSIEMVPLKSAAKPYDSGKPKPAAKGPTPTPYTATKGIAFYIEEWGTQKNPPSTFKVEDPDGTCNDPNIESIAQSASKDGLLLKILAWEQQGRLVMLGCFETSNLPKKA